jgi:hydrogenase-4 component F
VAIGVGLGGAWGLYGALLHTFNHAVGKALLFFTAGHVRQSLGTLRMDRISGLAQNLPRTTGALVLGSLAIVGLPPFGLFVSEFAILSEAFLQSRFFVASVFLVILSVVFGGMLHHMFAMLFGEPGPKPSLADLAFPESLPIMAAAACLLFFGLHVPAAFSTLLHQAMAVLGS